VVVRAGGNLGTAVLGRVVPMWPDGVRKAVAVIPTGVPSAVIAR
jgi:hypothetical protein